MVMSKVNTCLNDPSLRDDKDYENECGCIYDEYEPIIPEERFGVGDYFVFALIGYGVLAMMFNLTFVVATLFLGFDRMFAYVASLPIYLYVPVVITLAYGLVSVFISIILLVIMFLMFKGVIPLGFDWDGW